MNFQSVIILILFWFFQTVAYSQNLPFFETILRPSDTFLNVPEYSSETKNDQLKENSSIEKECEGLDQNIYSDQSKKFILDDINFIDNTIFTSEQLKKEVNVKCFIHRPVSFAELEELRRKVTLIYVNEGYITSGAIIDKNANGESIKEDLSGKKTLTIRVIEGVVSETLIKGNGRLRSGYIESRLMANGNIPLIANKGMPLKEKKLQENFQLLLMDPLFDRINARLLPSPELGKSILAVDVTRARPYQLSAISDNYRAPSVGPIALGANTRISNLTGHGDSLDFTFLTSAPTGGDVYQYGGNWFMPLEDKGTKFYFSANSTNVSIIEEPLISANIKSKSIVIEGGINQVLIEDSQKRLSIGSGVGFKENETNLLGEPFSFIPGLASGKNQISVVRVNQEYTQNLEPLMGIPLILAFRSIFNIGLNAFGSTIQKNHLNPDSEYLSWIGQTRTQWNIPSFKTDFVFKGAVQISNDPLLPLERMAVGGRHSVRGYRENQLVRDNGFAGSAELHIHLVGDSKSNFRFDLIPFFDFGAAWNNTDSVKVYQQNNSLYKTQHLYSTGVGFQFRMRRFSSEFFWAHRLGTKFDQQQKDLQDYGIHFQARLDAF